MKNIKRLILDVVSSENISPEDKGEFINLLGNAIKGKKNSEYVVPLIDGERIRIYNYRSVHCGEWWKLNNDKYRLIHRVSMNVKYM